MRLHPLLRACLRQRGASEPRAAPAERLVWHLQPPASAPMECGYDLVLLPASRVVLLTHSNSRGGVWARGRVTGGTVASFLELEALVQCEFELLEFLEHNFHHPQNFDSPT